MPRDRKRPSRGTRPGKIWSAMEKKTLADLVDLYPEDRAEETVLTFLAPDGAVLRSLSFRELKEVRVGVKFGMRN